MMTMIASTTTAEIDIAGSSDCSAAQSRASAIDDIAANIGSAFERRESLAAVVLKLRRTSSRAANAVLTWSGWRGR
jgi:hypothetical protein